MPIRSSTQANFDRVLRGLRFNLAKLVVSQEQIATGRRILRPSDDATGTSRVLSFNRQLAGTDRFLQAVGLGRSVVDAGAVALESASAGIAEAREHLLQGMNGTLSQNDRDAIASEIELLRQSMLELANGHSGGRALFGGTSSDSDPWEAVRTGGLERVLYRGNDGEQRIRVGDGVEVAITIPGSEIFGALEPEGTRFVGTTGASSGVTADEAVGYEYLTLRHDSTDPGQLATAGVALANGGADDTILGDQALVIDAGAGTVRLGDGPVRTLPSPGDPGAADFVLENAAGGELHLDFTGFAGASYTGVVSGAGSASLDGTTFAPVDFTSDDVRLSNAGSGNTVHVDATTITRAGRDLVHFEGTVNLFDALQGIADDLRNPDGLPQTEVVERLNVWLGELDRNHESLLVALGGLGSRSERLSSTESRLTGVQLQLESLRSEVLDTDFSEAALDMARAQQGLELAQATGVRLLQTNLLNFLG